MRVCTFSKDGSLPSECPTDHARLYVLEDVEAEGPQVRKLKRGNFWSLVFQILLDEPCDVICVKDEASLPLIAAAMLRMDKACVKIPSLGTEFSLVGTWMIFQLTEPLRTVAVYVLSKGEEGVSPKEIVVELHDILGLKKESSSSYKLAWNYLKELEKKGIVRRVARGKYVAREEVLRCRNT